MIVTNVVAYVGCVSITGSFSILGDSPGNENQFINSLCLQNGTVFPLQWLTSIFMHADPIHLIGNMLFLWSFGLIVEGKIGWWKFLLIYFGIGIVDSAIFQLILFPFSSGYVRVALGASGAISGIMAMALFWAPENDLEIFFIIIIIPYRYTTQVRSFVAVALAFDILHLFFSEFAISGAVSHLLGFIAGIAIAWQLLRMREVDCEGYDFISCWKGETGVRVKTREQEKQEKIEQQETLDFERDETEKAYASIQRMLEQGSADAALGRFEALRRIVPTAQWRSDQLYRLIRMLHQANRHRDSVQLMKIYIDKFQRNRELVALTLAQIFLKYEERPLQAKKYAESINLSALSPQQEELRRKIIEAADQRLEQGDIDFMD